jgi:thiol-disulfide isomerase/thioredoxin
MITRPFAKSSPLSLFAGLLIAATLTVALGAACGSDNVTGGPTPLEPTAVTDSTVAGNADSTSPEPTTSNDSQQSTADSTGSESISVGRNVGERVPDFDLALGDGTTRSSAQLIDAGKPVFLFFFATWCPVCRREMNQLKDIYPEFADNLQFIAIGQDPTEPLADLVAYRDSQGHSWPVALPGRGMLAELRITSQSFKIAFDGDGVIVYRDGYGGGDLDTWRSVMVDLASQ